MRIEEAVERGEEVYPSQIKAWRSEIRIPIMLQKIELTEEQREEIKRRQLELNYYFKARALRKVEEGSQYSSDNEDVEVSEYESTDNEEAAEIAAQAMSSVQYVVMKNAEGKDVYKRKKIKMNRAKKQRGEDYEEQRARILSARAKNRSTQQIAKIKKYSNMYANFSSNYHKTLDTIVEQSKKHLLNKA